MTAALLQFAVAAAVVVAAGGVLARAADRIAAITGFGRLLVGSVLLAGATSLPELAVDVSAVRAGLDDVAVGDLLGSSLFNLLILAIADLAHERRGMMLTRISRAHALSALLSIALTSIVGVMILLRPGDAVSPNGVGLGSIAVAVAYVLGVRLVARDQRARDGGAPKKGVPPSTDGKDRLAGALGRFAIAALAILVAAPFVADAAGRIAELSGLGGTFVGTTLVAASTSLPELVATVAAARLGSFDLAIGNVFGSNTFNMAMLLPIDAFSEGPLLSRVAPTHAITAFWVAAITSVAVMGLLTEDEQRRRFLDPDAIAIVTLVLAALLTVFLAG